MGTFTVSLIRKFSIAKAGATVFSFEVMVRGELTPVVLAADPTARAKANERDIETIVAHQPRDFYQMVVLNNINPVHSFWVDILAPSVQNDDSLTTAHADKSHHAEHHLPRDAKHGI